MVVKYEFPRPKRKCPVCRKFFDKPLNIGISHWIRRKNCSKACQYEARRRMRNEQSYTWKGENVLVYSKHMWLYRNFGKANHCENKDCEGKSKFYDWAKKTGLDYEKKRENFMQLCRSCHRRYDMTEEKKAKAIKNLHWYKERINI